MQIDLSPSPVILYAKPMDESNPGQPRRLDEALGHMEAALRILDELHMHEPAAHLSLALVRAGGQEVSPSAAGVFFD